MPEQLQLGCSLHDLKNKILPYVILVAVDKYYCTFKEKASRVHSGNFDANKSHCKEMMRKDAVSTFVNKCKL